MNDDFLHRLRTQPNPTFIAALKANLDREAAARVRTRRLFRTAIVAALIGGSAVAVAFVAWRGVPLKVGTAQVRGAQTAAPAPSKIIISSPTGGGAPRGADAPAAATASQGISSDAARSAISVAGVGGIVVNAQNFVRRPVDQGLMFAPQFTQTGTAQAIAMLCHVRGSAGADSAMADLVGADRRMMASELMTCKRNGVMRVTEVRAGYEVVVLARSALYGAPKLSAREIFLSLAAEVPDPNQPLSLIKNPYHVWNAIDEELSAEQIEILGPPLSSLAMAAFRGTVMEVGCASFAWIADLKVKDPERFQKICHSLRTDGVYKDLGYRASTLVEYLDTYPNAIALLNFKDMPSGVVAASVDGVEPTLEAFAANSYAGSRTLYLYLNAPRVAALHSLSDFVLGFARMVLDPASDTQLVPLEAERRQLEMRNVLTLPELRLN